MNTILILLAGGQGCRMNSARNKVLLPLCGKTVIRRSIEAFDGLIDHAVIVCRPAEKDEGPAREEQTVEQPVEEIARRSLNLLLDMMEKGAAPRHVLVDAYFRKRESVAENPRA